MATFAARIACWEDTKRIAFDMPAPPPSVKHVFEPLMHQVHEVQVRAKFVATVRVEDRDAIDSGLAWKAEGYNPVVLNLSDDVFAGGCVDIGSGAQEESLFRRTNYCRTLRNDAVPRLYPIGDGEAVYSPGVTVFKANEADGWTTLPAPWPTLAFIACPGVKYPLLDYATSSTPPEDATLKTHAMCIMDIQRL
jgi:hypothetical protein